MSNVVKLSLWFLALGIVCLVAQAIGWLPRFDGLLGAVISLSISFGVWLADFIQKL